MSPRDRKPRSIRLYAAVAQRSFGRATHYRAAVAAGVFVNTVFGYLRASVLVLVAATAGGAINGLTAVELATFAFVSQGFIMVTGAFGDLELAERVRNGDVVIDMYRPSDLQMWWLAVWLGRAGYLVWVRGVPPVLLGAIAFDLRWPDPLWHWVPFAVAVLLASIIGFALRFCTNVATFWLLDNRGLDQLMTVLVTFFAGLVMPIALFPSWLETISRWLPFASMIQLPAELYLGLHSGWSIVWVLGQQLMWATVVLGCGRLLLAAATTRVVVQGG